MLEKLNKVRKEHENFDRQLVDNFAKVMPDLLSIMIDGYLYGQHIGTKEGAILAEQFITDNKGNHVGFYFYYYTVINHIKNYADLNETVFYPTDAWVWANVKYGDMAHLTKDEKFIIDYAYAELTDTDYPFYDASKRPYFWLKKHIENKA